MAPGQRCPSENALAARFDVSRAVARSAVRELQRRHLVRRVRGSGTFVGRRIDYRISRDLRPSWHRTVELGGGVPRSVILSASRCALPHEPAQHLGPDVLGEVFRVERLNFIDDLVASYAVSWTLPDPVPLLAEGIRVAGSLDDVLREMGRLQTMRSWYRVGEVMPQPHVRDRLELPDDVSAWLVESVNTADGDGRPLTYTTAWVRGDAMRIIVDDDVPDGPRQ